MLMKNYSILIIDDEKSQREILSGFLSKRGYNVFTAESGTIGLKIIKEQIIDIVLSDYKMPEMTGIEILEEVYRINPEISFVIITAYGTVENAVKAMRMGAVDYISKPVNLDELEILLTRIIERKNLVSENQLLREQLQEKNKISSIISQSSKMEEVINLVSRSANSRATILIIGENGTGKEVIAKAIHYISARKEKPFIAINIPALSENLLESELFGHEKGSFTGAEKLKKGRFELADGGTLFLDEIGDMSINTQIKILRVLQEHQFERVGATQPIEVDVRIIAATNQDLEKKIKEGTFREDLYYRLNVVTIKIPSLRERKDDIPPLVEHFVKLYCKENNRHNLEVSKEAFDLLMKYNYPGNIRELENIIERAVVLTRDDIITVSDLPTHVRGFKEELSRPVLGKGTLPEQIEAVEKELIYDALKASGGNQTKAGKLLGITERNLRYKLKKYNIKH
jgi:two-component system NtrC family response regulator